MFARPLFRLTSQRYVQTSSAVLSEQGGMFSRLNPWAKGSQQQDQQQQQQPTEAVANATFDVDFQDKPSFESWRSQDASITDDEQIKSTIEAIVVNIIPDASASNFQQASLQNVDTKFKVVKETIQQIGKEVPNMTLNNIDTVQDLIDYFQTKPTVDDVSVQQFFTQQADSLPANLRFELPAKHRAE
ncbi:hypothetical protein DM01DRAFT_1338391 [Hesseltinella vesiculosa]|uniref:Large ribosomal subunit protein mL50 n=1 Tax=Hesseltinella vesiculosa TaxID=101127 RepID=A0A1X2G9Q2_9FUNG|nr:hypothetical protein DM01DRAFT_1338391 [Hesseltinella vesiculosa]